MHTISKMNGQLNGWRLDDNDHFSNAIDTPMKPGAFLMSDDDKIARIREHFTAIMDTLGLDLNDDSLKDTPNRVAKMFVKEIFSGLNPENKPAITLFDNVYQYNQILVEKNISFSSTCEHHFVPILGKAHVAYISSGKVIGLSKLNRIVQYYARRPQVQERMTTQIGEDLKEILQTEHVAVILHADHMCVHTRGVEDHGSSTITSFYSGKFINEGTRTELHRLLGMD
jgi:GTP cyclohydrolase IA